MRRVCVDPGAPRLLDCRNIYDPREMAQLGLDYVNVGRPRRRTGKSDAGVTDWLLPGRFAPVH